MNTLRIFILGGYGTFGTRLIRLLIADKGLTLICAGRSLAKANALVAKYQPEAEAILIAAETDRNGDLTQSFTEWKPDLIVDTSGPFQGYGERPYRVVEAAIAAGVTYIDIADGADFVTGISVYDEKAKAAGIGIISGASTFPALSAAIVEDLSKDWQSVNCIENGLAPSPRAGLGKNVIAAIMSYAGKPVSVIHGGNNTTAPALVDSRYFTVAPPGVEPLPPMRFSLVELPDQTLFPNKWTALRELWYGVGTRPQIMLRLLNLSSRIVHMRLLPSLSPFKSLAYAAMKLLPFGAHRGGLIMRVGGESKDGTPITREWHMIAEGDDGPFIPSMAVAALVKKIQRGDKPLPGAYPALGIVSLAEFESQFAGKQIIAGIRDHLSEDAPLYQHILGEAWQRLPQEIQALHTSPSGKHVAGRARVDRGKNPLARLIAGIVGFPKASEDVSVEVTFSVKDGVEHWQRNFDGRPFSSLQKRGEGSFEHLLSESFGPLEFGLALVLQDDKMWLKTIKWRAFGIPMPRFLAPSGDAYEHVIDGRFHFHVEIRHWMTGLIVRYRGWLE